MFDRMRFAGTWRDYQARALAEMDAHLDDERIHIIAAPGAGKTVLGIEIVRRIGRPALVFAPTLAIRDQWRERLTPLFLAEPPAPGEVSHDLSDPRAMTLVTYQSLDALHRADAIVPLAEALQRAGPMTIVLDEAHHLRREWWTSLDRLLRAVGDVRIVALTATPPYDASLAEWRRYEQLCGPADLEIGIADLVRRGDLCPHQDHVLLSVPGADERALLDARRYAIAEVQQALRADRVLLDRLAAHPWLINPQAHVEAILDAPEMLSAMLVLLHAAERPLPRPALDLLGVGGEALPPPSPFWTERLLDGLLFTSRDMGVTDAAHARDLRRFLDTRGLIRGARVTLTHDRALARRMTASIAKIGSIVEIARAEQATMGDRLRMVVLSDHVRAADLPAAATDAFAPTRLGVVPIFETLRRALAHDLRIGVLTGTLVFVPRSALPALRVMALTAGLGDGEIVVDDIAACPDHVALRHPGGGTAMLVRLVTALFTAGEIRILVGTQSLLGEGWDAPALNSLVLASNTASYVLSNQMRGRAIRIDPADPDKVANIWHLATIDPVEGLGDLLGARFEAWFDGAAMGARSDIAIVERRMRAYEGISNGDTDLIESGIARLGLGSDSVVQANARTLALAADRATTAARWRRSLGQGDARSHVREAATARYAPRVLSWYHSLHALGWSALAGGAFAAANELRMMGGYETLGALAMVAAGGFALGSLPRLARAARLVWRNGSIEASLASVGHAVLAALRDRGLASEEEVERAAFVVRTSLDGRKDVVVTGVRRPTEMHILRAIAEIVGPVENPRYLLVRRARLGWRIRTDYHAVPTIFGERREDAERFAGRWRSRIGPSDLVFTRSAEGRVLLLKARAQSFAAGMTRRVDRRSVWL